MGTCHKRFVVFFPTTDNVCYQGLRGHMAQIVELLVRQSVAAVDKTLSCLEPFQSWQLSTSLGEMSWQYLSSVEYAA